MNRLARALAGIINRIPRRVRRSLADTRLVHVGLAYLFGDRRTRCATPEGSTLVVNPLYHTQFVHHDIHDYEPTVRAAFERLCRPGGVVYDVGANVGVFTSLAASLVGESGLVVAFEPEPNNIRCLEETIALNSWSNVRLVPQAVGRLSHRQSFDRRGGAFSGRLVDHGGYKTTPNVTQVDCVALDDWVERGEAPPPDVVKIDVEGNELLVVSGMEALLDRTAPVVVCELHRHLGDTPQQVQERLERHGYGVVDLEDFVRDRSRPLVDIQECHCIVASKRASSVRPGPAARAARGVSSLRVNGR